MLKVYTVSRCSRSHIFAQFIDLYGQCGFRRRVPRGSDLSIIKPHPTKITHYTPRVFRPALWPFCTTHFSYNWPLGIGCSFVHRVYSTLALAYVHNRGSKLKFKKVGDIDSDYTGKWGIPILTSNHHVVAYAPVTHWIFHNRLNWFCLWFPSVDLERSKTAAAPAHVRKMGVSSDCIVAGDRIEKHYKVHKQRGPWDM